MGRGIGVAGSERNLTLRTLGRRAEMKLQRLVVHVGLVRPHRYLRRSGAGPSLVCATVPMPDLLDLNDDERVRSLRRHRGNRRSPIRAMSRKCSARAHKIWSARSDATFGS
jgi:hypothetical protein